MNVTPTNVILLCLDGVGAHWLGPYGGTVCETPAWNRLAAESLLFESCYAAGPQFDRSCRAIWNALPSLDRHRALLTDIREAAESPHAAMFDERLLLPPPVRDAAAEIDETGVAQCFAAASHWIAERSDPYLLCLHASALFGPWDAPYALRQQIADEEDPDPPDFVAPPRLTLPPDCDPDLPLGFLQSYAGQLAAVDWALGALLDEWMSTNALDDAILVVTSTRGYALGEHGEVGGDANLYGEMLQTPCLIRFPDERFAGERSQRILPAGEIPVVLRDALGSDESNLLKRIGFGPTLADAACVAVSEHDGRSAIRTPCWFLTEPTEGPPRLYAKPDDRWEVNEVSALCPDAVGEMRTLLATYREAQQSGAAFTCELSELMHRGYDA